MIIKPKNWHNFQHYKKRNPPWIKLHKTLLDNYEFHLMSDASKSLALCLWLIASESESGEVDADPKKLAFRLRTTPDKINKSIKELIDNDFFFLASGVLAECKQDASKVLHQSRVEKSREEKSTSDFEVFYKAYPKHVGKKEALRIWKRDKPPLADILKALEWQCKSEQWNKDDGLYIPMPSTYLNQKRWEDEPVKINDSVHPNNVPRFIPPAGETGWWGDEKEAEALAAKHKIEWKPSLSKGQFYWLINEAEKNECMDSN